MKKKLIITAIIIFICMIISILYARFVGTRGLNVKEYLIVNKKIPESFYGVKVVHISDIHYGRITKEKELTKLVESVNKSKPDIVVLTGDLLDKKINYSEKDLNIIIDKLNQIDAKMGKYIITGNDDYLNTSYDYLKEKLQFVNLDNNYQILYNETNEAIMLAGIDTISNNIPISQKFDNILPQFENDENNIKYSILIMHEPDTIDKFDYKKFDLVLAGHSLGGQIKIPLIGSLILPKNAKKYYGDYYKLNNTKFYISSGIGTSNTNLRLNNKPSYNLYRLVNK